MTEYNEYNFINTADFINNINNCNNLFNKEKLKSNYFEDIISLICPICKLKGDENDIITSNGYLICSLCGLVLKSEISDAAEWNNYTDSDGNLPTNSRCGASTKTTDVNPFDNTIYSFIPKGIKNTYYEEGKQIKYDVSNIHIKNTYNYQQKTFNIVDNQLDTITNDKYSKRIVMTAKTLWAEIMKSKKINRAGVRKGLIACCLYYSCLHYNCTRSPLEICKDFGMEDTKQFIKGDKEFKETFENMPKWAHLLTKASNSDDYFSRFCSDLEVEHLIKENTAFQIAKECRELYEENKSKFTNISPKSSACAIIFWVLKKNKINITKTSLSKVLNICSPTLTKTCQLIISILGDPENL